MAALLLLADADWHRMDGGWWVAMAIGMIAFWAVVIGAIVWLLRGGLSARGAGRREDPLEILDRRLAEGAVDVDEYERRRKALGKKGGSGEEP